MSTGAMRRAQLVTPFGVGAMSVLVDGTSVITAGLDHWYDPSPGSQLALEEFEEHDWRLEARLRVSHFRLPPDYRRPGQSREVRNIKLTVPVLRFPRWSFCMYCKRLEQSVLTMQQPVLCPDEKHADMKNRPRMSQVPFVTVCANGHLDDFPFRQWVHRSANPRCLGALRLKSAGGGGLEGQRVICDECKAERSLRGITEARTVAGEEQTVLSSQLEGANQPFLCTGSRPWLGDSTGLCGESLRGALRAAGNVYFPKVESSIYLPVQVGAVSAEMHELMRHPAVSVTMRTLHSIFGSAVTVKMLREQLLKNVPAELFGPVSDDELIAGFRDLLGVGQSVVETDDDVDVEFLTGDDEWRYPEFQHIRETPKDDFLTTRDPGLHQDLKPYLERVRSVDVLRETRALRGFTRIRDDVLRLSEGKSLLRRTPLAPPQDWLPAYVVKGEGIYFELNPEELSAWEGKAEVQARAQRITDLYGQVALQRGLQGRELSPRFILIHTLSHLLINELVFTCGYSSASLRERIYVSHSKGHEMAGLLIYTAAGDSEGTLGGLVRMAREDNLGSVFRSAISDARWCSTDPVCMDAGERGQGPDSCNLAACHGCALLPETSCEEFNRFLDRGLVVGTLKLPELGFFSRMNVP
jgi:hypothetical protein